MVSTEGESGEEVDVDGYGKNAATHVERESMNRWCGNAQDILRVSPPSAGGLILEGLVPGRSGSDGRAWTPAAPAHGRGYRSWSSSS